MSLDDPDFSRNRFEIKYLVSARRIEHIKEHLADIIVADRHHGEANDGYYNHSIYFDSPGFSHYTEKHEGLNRRVKVRLRAHRERPDGPPTRLFLELKHRLGHIGMKERHVVDEERARAILAGRTLPGLVPEPGDAERPGVSSTFYYLVKKSSLHPVVSILYHRSAYHTPLYGDVRITFDTGVRASSMVSLDAPLSSFNPCLDPRDCVVELKFFKSVPRLITRRFNELGLRQVTLSKYAAGVESTFHQIIGLNQQGDRAPRSRPA